MVGTENLGMDACALQLAGEPCRGEEVIDAPPRVLLACPEAVRPPRVNAFLFGIEIAERIDESRVQQGLELLAFLVGEACVHAVGLRILQVYLLVRHVQVAAYQHGLLCVKFQEVPAEGILPRHPVVQALQSVLRVGV